MLQRRGGSYDQATKAIPRNKRFMLGRRGSAARLNDTALKRLEAASQIGLASAHKHKFREDCNDTPARDRLG